VKGYPAAPAAALASAVPGCPADLGQTPAAVVLSAPLLWLSPFLWPAYMLMMLGLFGHTVD
jgi:hypothetical protein